MKSNLELALEAGAISCGHPTDPEEIAAIDNLVALVEARLMAKLLEGTGEPVAWMRPTIIENGYTYESSFRDHSTVIACNGGDWSEWKQLYTADQTAADVLREREECAKECDIRAGSIARRAGYSEGLAVGYKNAAAAIRNRGTK